MYTDNASHHITHFEMLNVLICVRLWGHEWRHRSVTLCVDNEAVVTVCNTGYTKDQFLAQCIRNIWLFTSEFDLQLNVIPVPGYSNKTADLLSRWVDNEQFHSKLRALVPCPIWQEIPEGFFTLNHII